MITINKPIKIPDNDIFENDLLDREEAIKDLSSTPLILQLADRW
jgi:hypothetical protein